MAENKSMIFKSSSFYGMLLGLFWVFKYMFFVFGYQFPLLMMVYIALTIFTVIIAYNMTRAYKLVAGGRISFFHAWQFGVLLYMYASLIVSLAHYVFYAYIAPPDFIANLIDIAIQRFEGTDIAESLKAMAIPSPIQMVIQLIINNIFYGVILSIPVAWLASRKDDSGLIEELKDNMEI